MTFNRSIFPVAQRVYKKYQKDGLKYEKVPLAAQLVDGAVHLALLKGSCAIEVKGYITIRAILKFSLFSWHFPPALLRVNE